MVSSPDVASLKALLEKRFPGTELRSRARERLATGYGKLDALLGGGLPTPGLSEWVGPGAAAAGRLISANVIRGGEHAAWIDSARELTYVSAPEGAMIFRPENEADGLAVAEKVIRSGGYRFVVMSGSDLTSGAAVRLTRAAREGDCSVLVHGVVPTGASVRIASSITAADGTSASLRVRLSGSGVHRDQIIEVDILPYEIPATAKPALGDRRGDTRSG